MWCDTLGKTWIRGKYGKRGERKVENEKNVLWHFRKNRIHEKYEKYEKVKLKNRKFCGLALYKKQDTWKKEKNGRRKMEVGNNYVVLRCMGKQTGKYEKQEAGKVEKQEICGVALMKNRIYGNRKIGGRKIEI